MKRKSILVILLVLLGRLQSCDFQPVEIPSLECLDQAAGQLNRLLEALRHGSLDPGNLYRMLPAQNQ